MIRKVAAKTLGLYLNSVGSISKPYAAKQALQLFTRPFSGRYSSDDLNYLKSAAQLEIITDEDHIAYHHWPGNGRTVLFLHGWESNALRWKPYLEHLQEVNLNIFAIDAPGHGLSKNRTINVIRYAKGIDAICRKHEPEILVGHSLGGMACGYYLKRFQFTAKELVLLSTPSGLEDMMYRFFDILSLRKDLMPNLEQIFSSRYDVDLAQFSTAFHLKGIDIEGILIHDQMDDVTPYVESLEINRSWESGKMITTKNLGHSLKNEELIQSICAYLSKGTIPVVVNGTMM